MITVTAPIWLWREGQGRWHFLTITPDESVELRLSATAAKPRQRLSMKAGASVFRRLGSLVYCHNALAPEGSVNTPRAGTGGGNE